MKEIPLSTCEKNSVIAAVEKGIRHDGRRFREVRAIKLQFGKDYGCCTVSMGQTRVLAQVTCEVVEPRPSRPNEGKISIAIHLSPMAAPHFEPGRSSDLVDEVQQILDRNIKESRCLDLESLCIMAEESVWQFKVDVTVLNHDGNLADACNLAAVAALRHFHRPDVSVEEDGRVTVYTLEEREPIPTFMKKIPVCLTYAFFVVGDKGYMLMDPTDLEERVMSGKMIIGLNPHGEITSMVFPGRVCLEKQQIMGCIENAFSTAQNNAELVQNLVEEDLETRKNINKPDGFTDILLSDKAYNLSKLEGRIIEAQTAEFLRPYRSQNKEDTGIKMEPTNSDESDESEEEFPSQNIHQMEMNKFPKFPSQSIQQMETNEADFSAVTVKQEKDSDED